MQLWLALVAFWIAVLADWKGIFTRSLGDRVAALLALYSFRVFFRISGLDDRLIGWGRGVERFLGKQTSHMDPLVSQFLGTFLLASVALVVGTLWVLAFIPTSFIGKWLGGATNQQFKSWIIWGGAFVMTTLVGAIPGGLGDFLRWVSSAGADAGGFLIGWAA